MKRHELVKATKLTVIFVDEMCRTAIRGPSLKKPVYVKKSPLFGDYSIEDAIILRAIHEIRKLHTRDMSREIARKIKTSSPTSEIDFGFIKITVDIEGLRKTIERELELL